MSTNYTDYHFRRPSYRRSTWVHYWPVVLLLVTAAAIVWWFRPLGLFSGSLHDPGATPRDVTPRGALPPDEQAVVDMYEEARQSVVYITTSSVQRDMLSL